MRGSWKIASVDLRYLQIVRTHAVSHFMGIAPNTLVHIFTGRMTDIEKRNRTFLIRLNDDEYEVIKKRAEKMNM